MKKYLLIFLTVILIFGVPISIGATEKTDSVNIRSADMALLESASSDNVIKLYNGSYMRKFARRDSIEQMIVDSDEVYMVVPAFGSVEYKRISDGKANAVLYGAGLPDRNGFFRWALQPGTVLGASVKVKNVYCLNGEPSHNGVYIYYETDKGDYVLYKEYLSASEQYLFELEEFYKFAEVVQATKEKFKDSDGGMPAIGEIYNVKPFKIVLIPIWLRWVAAVVILGAVAVVVPITVKAYRKKKNNKAPI